MHVWEATLVVLFEKEENHWTHYTTITNEIIERGLARFTASEPAQSVGKLIRENNHFEGRGGKTGYYRLKDRARSSTEYHRLTWSIPRTHVEDSEDAQQSSSKHSLSMETERTSDRVTPVEKTEPTSEAMKVHKIDRTKRKIKITIVDQLIAEEVPSSFEGRKKRIYVNAYERNRSARMRCIRHYKFSCMVCEMKFSDEYGEIGAGFIHVHHLLAFSQASGDRQTDPVNDLRPVCPSCHAMIHRGENIRGTPFTIEEIIEFRRNARQVKVNESTVS